MFLEAKTRAVVQFAKSPDCQVYMIVSTLKFPYKKLFIVTLTFHRYPREGLTARAMIFCLVANCHSNYH